MGHIAATESQIDAWLNENAAAGIDAAAYTAFLGEIGYLVEESDDFSVETGKVDPEIASIAGPQLVVPITNARYALNAANARFGSLYDAFYGTDAIPAEEKQVSGYDPVRGGKVIARVRAFLDEVFPLDNGSWTEVTGLSVSNGALGAQLGDASSTLANTAGFAGHIGNADAPQALVLKNNGLHVLISIDPHGNRKVACCQPAADGAVVVSEIPVFCIATCRVKVAGETIATAIVKLHGSANIAQVKSTLVVI